MKRLTTDPATIHLAETDPRMAALIAKVGALPLEKPGFREPYHALLSAVAHQQLHARAALAILGRLKTVSGGELPEPAALLALSDEVLRGCGFSAAKAAAIRDIAAKAEAGVVPARARAMRLSDAALIERLTTIRGVGRWTVEMLLIFTLRRPDVFPVDDFGVREGYRVTFGLEVPLKPRALAAAAEVFAPHRSLAARYFWRAADMPKVAAQAG
jgi:DNA-3-methyladenine glycosylase II